MGEREPWVSIVCVDCGREWQVAPALFEAEPRLLRTLSDTHRPSCPAYQGLAVVQDPWHPGGG